MHSPNSAATRTEEGRRPVQRRVLVVDDEEAVSAVFAKALKADYEVTRARNGYEAARLLQSQSFDVIVSDISMPEMTGIELLQMVRRRDLDVPVILVTGKPDLHSAIRAVEHGALRYLEKPVSPRALREVVTRAAQLHKLAKVKREAMALLLDRATEASDRAGLQAAFTDMLESLRIHFQPILRCSTRRAFAYEALLRPSHPTLPSPIAALQAAERLGRMHELGRVVRRSVAGLLERIPADLLVFVNLHPLEFTDPELNSPEAPLSAHAPRVVLEVTERAHLDEIEGLEDRVAALRGMRYRLALDDLGAGYAGLTSFVRLNPEFVKVDMALIRGIHLSEPKQILWRSTRDLCREMAVEVIAEGVETADEYRTLSELGADLLQGYFLGQPAEIPATPSFESIDP